MNIAIGFDELRKCEHKLVEIRMKNKNINPRVSLSINAIKGYYYGGCVHGGIGIHHVIEKTQFYPYPKWEHITFLCNPYILKHFIGRGLNFTSNNNTLSVQIYSFLSSFQAAFTIDISGTRCVGIYHPYNMTHIENDRMQEGSYVIWVLPVSAPRVKQLWFDPMPDTCQLFHILPCEEGTMPDCDQLKSYQILITENNPLRPYRERSFQLQQYSIGIAYLVPDVYVLKKDPSKHATYVYVEARLEKFYYLLMKTGRMLTMEEKSMYPLVMIQEYCPWIGYYITLTVTLDSPKPVRRFIGWSEMPRESHITQTSKFINVYIKVPAEEGKYIYSVDRSAWRLTISYNGECDR